MNFLLQEQRASAYVLWRAGDLLILFHLFVYSHMNLCLSSRASILFSRPELYAVWFSLLLRLFPLRPPELFEVGFHPLRRALVLLNLVLGTSVLSDVRRCSGLISCFPDRCPRTGRFPEEPCFLFRRMVFRNKELVVEVSVISTKGENI